MKVHIAIAVNNLEESIRDYSIRLKSEPELVVQNQYALWRTEILNLSIRVTGEDSGIVRHIGFEDEDAISFTASKDCNGLLWENFNKKHLAEEIELAWPGTNYSPK